MGNWSFEDANLAEDFSNYVRTQVHYYQDILEHTVKIGEWFLSQNTTHFLDFGCGNGELSSMMLERFPGYVTFIDSSPDMMSKAYNSTSDYTRRADGFNCINETSYFYNFVAVNLVLQFNRRSARLPILQSIYERMVEGGGIVITEKCQSESILTSRIHTSILHNYKLSKGVTHKEVIEKDESINGILVPLTVEENIQLIKDAGFKNVEVMFKFGEFVMFMAVK